MFGLVGLLKKRREKGIFSEIPNELIFDQILCYFEYKWILQTARLVCKLWNDHHKTIKTNQFKITYRGNIEKIILLMNEHSDELHQVTELIVFGANDSNVELERQFVSKLINLQNLDLWAKDCDISIIKEFVRLKNLKIIQLCHYGHFEEFVHSPSKIKSFSVFRYGAVISEVDFSNLNVNWPLEEFTLERLTSKSIMSLLKNEIMTKNLINLTISYSKLDENTMQEIETSTLSKLRELNLFKNSINNRGLCNFRNLTNITKLSLMLNFINNEGANYLSSVTSLTYLDLRNNKISDEGLKNYWKLSNLLELDLNYNEIGNIGANYLSQITNITSLNLNNNYLFDEEGLKNFGNLSKLKTLHLENNQIGNGFEYLSNCKQISTLDVSNNHISEECVLKYCEMKPLSITDLIISNNPIGNSGFSSLLKLPELTTIQANKCGISDKGIFKMLEIIPFKQSMKLHLEQNYLTNKSLKKMIESKHIENIQQLYISNNSELDSNYLTILSKKHFDFRYCSKMKPQTEESEEPEDKKNLCTIQ